MAAKQYKRSGRSQERIDSEPEAIDNQASKQGKQWKEGRKEYSGRNTQGRNTQETYPPRLENIGKHKRRSYGGCGVVVSLLFQS